VDQDDNSLTRSNAYMLDLIKRTGLNLRYNIQQKGFPKGLYAVRMYVLQP
jgi:protein N-terminal methyltransferase